MSTRDKAIEEVYSLILNGDTEEARDAAQAILMIDQADAVRNDLQV